MNIPYTLQWAGRCAPNCLFSCGGNTLGHRSPYDKRYLDRVIHFCSIVVWLTVVSNRHTHTLADHAIGKCLPVLLCGTEACPINSAMRHSLQFALNRALFKIFRALSKDTYKDICKYFGIRPMDEQTSARQSKFYLRYCATKSAVCRAISKLR